jgi:hypothetical protein
MAAAYYTQWRIWTVWRDPTRYSRSVHVLEVIWAWLTRRWQPEDQIGFQGLEWDEESGELRPK